MRAQLAAVLVLALLVGGCASTRENARAVIQAQQATEAAGRVLTAPEVQAALAKLSPDDRAALMRAIASVVSLVRCANE